MMLAVFFDSAQPIWNLQTTQKKYVSKRAEPQRDGFCWFDAHPVDEEGDKESNSSTVDLTKGCPD